MLFYVLISRYQQMLAQPSTACAHWTYLLKKNCNFSAPAYLTSQNIPEVQNTVHCIMCNVYKRCQSLFFYIFEEKKNNSGIDC